MFSWHPNVINLGREGMYARGWRTTPHDRRPEIERFILKTAHSPITWHNGVRLRSSFYASNWLGLDFDGGDLTLARALEKFAPYEAVIAISRSHQIAKGDSPPCDRYHAYFRLERVIRDATEYEECVRYYAALWGADPNCTDAARKYNPCRAVIPLPDAAGKKQDLAIKRWPKTPYVARQDLTADGRLPGWVLRTLAEGPDDASGSRNRCAYRVAIRMREAKISAPDAIDRIMASAIPIPSSHVRSEIEAVVRSAYRFGG